MSEPDAILDAARWVLGRNGPLAGKKVVVTAGGTREAIDPVRFVGNHSSGKMGFALASAARDRGAEVTLVHGPVARTVPHGVRAMAVESAEQMQAAVLDAAVDAAAIIMAAAVADYRPKAAAEHKIKKTQGEMALELVRTPDILAAVTTRRAQSGSPRVVIGFAAETCNVLENAREKLTRKGLDLIVANDVLAADSGFGVDTNRVILIDAGGGAASLPLMSKQAVAEAVLDRLAALLGRC
jgi:phosphopantothenoylcysteine decarboxylase/phosphopantothenate--cysteine ligase